MVISGIVSDQKIPVRNSNFETLLILISSIALFWYFWVAWIVFIKGLKYRSSLLENPA